MKKKLIVVIGVMAFAAVIGLTSSKFGIVSADPYYSVEDIRKQVTELYPGKITELELEKEGKNPIYEVEIEVDGYEYELKIDGNTGEILKLEEKRAIVKNTDRDNESNVVVNDKPDTAVEVDDDNQAVVDNGQATKDNTQKYDDSTHNNTNTNNSNTKKETEKTDQPKNQSNKKDSTKKAVIGYEEAKRIALSHFDGIIEDIELDDDDNRLVYEIEIERGNQEAEIKIDAYTGEVLVIKIDSDDDDDDRYEDKNTSNSTNKSVISYEEAKRIALGQFNGTMKDIELDDHDGRLVYEVEIERGDIDADIKIDAYTGKVLKVDIDD